MAVRQFVEEEARALLTGMPLAPGNGIAIGAHARNPGRDTAELHREDRDIAAVMETRIVA